MNPVLKQKQFLHEQKLRRKVIDYSKGSKNFWSFLKTVKNAKTSSIPHLIKDGQTFTSVEKANILSEMMDVKIHHFPSLTSHSLRHGPHALCLKSIFEQGKLKKCLQISIKSRYKKVVWTRWYSR